MSWRAESTFKPSSALNEDEKEFMKLVKKIRDILKLEERMTKGEKLEGLQVQKVESLPNSLKDLGRIAARLPHDTSVLEKNQDVVSMLPNSALKHIDQKREKDQARKVQRDIREKEERDRPEHMSRHDRPITGICVSSDGKHIWTCSKDKYVICWSTADTLLRSVRTYSGHQGAVWAVDISDYPGTPPRLLTGGADWKINLWSGEPPSSASGGRGGSPAVLTEPQASVDQGGLVKVLRWCPFDAAAPAAEGKRFAAASEKFQDRPAAISVYRVNISNARARPEQACRLENLPTKANDLRWGGGATTKLFSAHDNGYIGVWGVDGAGSLLKTIRVHTGAIASLCLSEDGATLLTASHDSSACAVDVSSRETPVLATYRANRPINAVGCSQNFRAGEEGYVVVAGGRDPREVTTSKLLEDEFEAKVLDAVEGEPQAAGSGHFGPVHRLLFVPGLAKGEGFATISEDGCLKIHGTNGRLLHSDTIQG